MANVSKPKFIFINFYLPPNANLFEDLSLYINWILKIDFDKTGRRKAEL